jgi:excisionase family DNA binding protein
MNSKEPQPIPRDRIPAPSSPPPPAKQTAEMTLQGTVIYNTITAPPYYFKEILSFEDAVEYLSIPGNTLYQLMHKRQIPFYKPSLKKVYFKRMDLDAFMLRNRVAAEYELEDKAEAILNGAAQ